MIYQDSRLLKSGSMQQQDVPCWAGICQTGQEIYDWILSGQETTFSKDTFSLFKTKKRIFSILYHSGGECKNSNETARLAGIFNHATQELTDVSGELQETLQVKNATAFRRKASVKPQLEQAVNMRLMFYLEYDPGCFYELGREILPVISRSEVEQQARLLQESGVLSDDVYFQPEYSFEDMTGRFSGQIYLLYLEAGERIVDAIARRWIQEKGAEMFRKKILYGCIRESLFELERKKERYLIKQNRQAQRPD